MSPEQVRGQAADLWSDIFLFGVLIYELTSGLLTCRFQSGETGSRLAVSSGP
jgi:serine/threonine protein kinase